MTEEQKEKYANFLDKVSEILGLNKPVDILRLCAVTDEYLRPIEKHITELEKENAELKSIADFQTSSNIDKERLTKAKGIIQSFVWWHTGEDRGSIDSNDLVEQAEQFLKEI